MKKIEAKPVFDLVELTSGAVPTPQQLPLKSIDDVRVEMAKIYRLMKGDAIIPEKGTKLVYVLSQIGKLIELHELERRIEALEMDTQPKRISA